MFRWIGHIQVWIIVQMIRYGWYQQRKAEGHPITLWRAFFSEYPRFGIYNEGEEGCPAAVDYMYQSFKD